MRGGLGRGASGRRAGASGVSPAHTKDAAVTEERDKASPVCTVPRGCGSAPGCGQASGGPCPASPGAPSSPALPAAAWSLGGMEQGWLSTAEPRNRRYTPAKHPASCGWGLKP